MLKIINYSSDEGILFVNANSNIKDALSNEII